MTTDKTPMAVTITLAELADALARRDRDRQLHRKNASVGAMRSIDNDDRWEDDVVRRILGNEFFNAARKEANKLISESQESTTES